jgi:Ca2+-binding RTX toxin-like protein
MVGTVLHIDGTTGDDVITLSQTPGKKGNYDVKIGTTRATFPKSLVSRIIIHGNAGNDKITVKKLNPHPWVLSIFGDDGNDTISSADGRDGIQGGAGNDFISGTGGHDTIQGGAGNDVILGGGGNDRLYGQDGNDTIYGGAGGNDTISGGAGDDILASNEQYLSFVGQKAVTDVGGNDVLDSGDGNDWLLDGTQNAIIKDRGGRDTMTGGAGADVLDARGSSIITDKNKADGDYVPAEDYTPASNQPGIFHARITLTIKVKNAKGQYDTVMIPAFIGYFNAATPADIRTKAADSIVYFDPRPGSAPTWTLGDVFRTWGISFDSTHLGRYFAATGHALTLTINGVSNTDFANAALPVIGTTPTAVVITVG